MKSIPLLLEIPVFVFCENDDMTIGAIKVCKELNVRVLDNTVLINFDVCIAC